MQLGHTTELQWNSIPSVHFDTKSSNQLHISPFTPPILPMEQQVHALKKEAAAEQQAFTNG